AGAGDGPLLPDGHDVEIHHGPGAAKDSRQRIVVGDRDRIELVIVASGTTERQTQERAPDSIDLLVHDVHLHLDRIVLRQHLWANAQEARGDQAVGVDTWIVQRR